MGDIRGHVGNFVAYGSAVNLNHGRWAGLVVQEARLAGLQGGGGGEPGRGKQRRGSARPR